MSKTYIMISDRNDDNTLAIDPADSITRVLHRLIDNGFLVAGTTIELPGSNEKVKAEWGELPRVNTVIFDAYNEEPHCLALTPGAQKLLNYLAEHGLLADHTNVRYLEEEEPDAVC